VENHGTLTSPAGGRLSGVTEWKNAVFLWVNIGGITYANIFMEEVGEIGS
ncbi:unnamed protein product, partial [Phaeothamnion confervicola]